MVKASIPPVSKNEAEDPLVPKLSPRQLEFRRIINVSNKADRVSQLTELLESTNERRKENMMELTEEVSTLRDRQAKGWAWLHNEANKTHPKYDAYLSEYTKVVDKMKELGVTDPEPQVVAKEDEERVDRATDLFSQSVV